MFLYASVLYYEWDLAVLTDEDFDDHCHKLLKWWPHLPEWFKARVTREDLNAGTGFAVTIANDERLAAVEWFERVRGPISTNE
nr:hypothetical protein [Aminobacter sp. HY435]